MAEKSIEERQRQEESSSSDEILKLVSKRWREQQLEDNDSAKRLCGAWEKEQTETAGSEDWEKVYSYEEKRLKSLVYGQGYRKWEEENRLWEIQNGLVPIAEEVSPEEEKMQKDLEAKRQRQNEIRLALSLRSLQLQDQKKQEEAFYKRLQELHVKTLTEEEKILKQSYLENAEKARLGIIKFEDFRPYGPGWDLAFYDVPDVEQWDPEPTPTPPPIPELLFRKHPHPAAEGSRTPVRSNFSTEERCSIGPYLTPYCKCDPNCCNYHIPRKEYPPEIAPIQHEYSRQCRQTHCFDIDVFVDGRAFPLAPFKNFSGQAEIMMELANRAIQEYNEKESNVFNYKVLKIEKVNRSVAMYNTYWMTVKLLNLTLGTPIETFQIHACFSYVNDDSDVLCYRPKEEPIVGLPSCEFCFGLLPGRVTGGHEP